MRRVGDWKRITVGRLRHSQRKHGETARLGLRNTATCESRSRTNASIWIIKPKLKEEIERARSKMAESEGISKPAKIGRRCSETLKCGSRRRRQVLLATGWNQMSAVNLIGSYNYALVALSVFIA